MPLLAQPIKEGTKRILVPTDCSEGVEHALKNAVRSHDLYHTEICLPHILTILEYVSALSAKTKIDSEADDVLQAAKKRALKKLEDIIRRMADKLRSGTASLPRRPLASPAILNEDDHHRTALPGSAHVNPDPSLTVSDDFF
jgi:hypothetical protein